MTDTSPSLDRAPWTTSVAAETEPPAGHPTLEAAARRQARLVARRLPRDVHCVAIIRGPGCGAWCGPAAVELAAALSETRTYTLLGNLEPGGGRLDGWLATEEPGGLTDVVRGWEVVANIAVPSWVHGFIYLPAGDDALPAPDLTSTPAFRSLVERVREKGSVLLLYAPPGLSPDAFPPGLLDGFVVLGEDAGEPGGRAPGRPEGEVAASPPGVPLLGAVRPPRRAGGWSGGGRRGPARTLVAAGRLAPDRPSAAVEAPRPAPTGGVRPGAGRGAPPAPPAAGRGGVPSRGRGGVARAGAVRTGPGDYRRGPGGLLGGRRRIRSRALAGAAGVLLTVAIALLLSWLIARHDPIELLLDPWGEPGAGGRVGAP